MRKTGKKVREGQVDANLTPILNVLFLLIPALLLAMEVASFSAVSVSPPKFCDHEMSDDPVPNQPEPLNLKVFVMEDGFRVAASGQQLGAEAGRDRDSASPTIPLRDPGAELHHARRFDFEALEVEARRFKQMFPHETVVTVSAESDIPLQALVSTIDALRGRDCRLLRAFQGETVPPECLFWEPIVEAGAG